MLKQEKFAKHNKSSKRMQWAVHWVEYSVHIFSIDKWCNDDNAGNANNAGAWCICACVQPSARSFTHSVCISFLSINTVGSSMFILSQWVHTIQRPLNEMYLPIKLPFKVFEWKMIKKRCISLSLSLLLLKRYLSSGRLRARFNRHKVFNYKTAHCVISS